MEFRELGRSGLRVSAVGLGVMTFGAQTPEDDAFRQLDLAFEAGVTLFDTAENYPVPVRAETQGRSEEILGRWIAARGVRDQVVVATKAAGPGNAAGDMTHIRGPDRRLDRANLKAAADASLHRLNTDYIDLYQVHWPERPITTQGRTRFSHLPDAPGLTPIEETLAALGELVAAGKVRQIGVANESPWGVMRYLAAAEARGLPRIVSIQNGYSLLDRQFELGLAEIAMREQVGLIAYAPLAGGLLTGKYAETRKPIEGSRSAVMPGFAQARFTPKKLAATAAYVDLARRNDLDPAEMALAFVRQRPFTTSVLMAASRAPQLQANLKSLALTLPPELIKAIDAIHDDQPNPR
ncbi:aldo/keto reductase [Phenylobacterium sp. LjRoot225]|uniref:aldo/keto reductase n=1 Tax=Phenylobacterium sp. LjRoot225 TaxID=3342285 RepID=UPI003ECC33E6